MPLAGRQFRNTFWNNEGGMQEFVDRGGNAPNQGEGPDQNLQGMLFSPYHGTGLRQDPTIPQEERSARIRKGLGLNDVEAYRNRLAHEVPGQAVKTVTYDNLGRRYTTVTPKVGERAATADMQLVHDAANRSDIPTQIFDQANAQVVVDPKPGRAWAHLDGGSIKLNRETGTRRVAAPSDPVPEYTRGKPIPNKSFSSQVGKVDWDSHEGAHGDMASTATFFDHTGKEYDLHEDVYKAEHDFRELPEGHSANVWPGKGKSTDKYIATPFEVWNGTKYHGGDKIRTFHTRHEAVPTGKMLPGDPDRMVIEKFHQVDRGTLVHELGHSLDSVSGGRFDNARRRNIRTDPMSEAIGDGFADRFSRAAGRYEETLHPSPERAAQIKNRGSGYGADFHVWKGRSVDKALYAAVRQHVSMGDHHFQDLPNRDHLAKDLGVSGLLDAAYTKKAQNDAHVEGNQMVLGHLYHQHEHVRQILDHLGMKKVGEQARDKYVERAQQASPSSPFHIPVKKQGQQWEQLAL